MSHLPASDKSKGSIVNVKKHYRSYRTFKRQKGDKVISGFKAKRAMCTRSELSPKSEHKEIESTTQMAFEKVSHRMGNRVERALTAYDEPTSHKGSLNIDAKL